LIDDRILKYLTEEVLFVNKARSTIFCENRYENRSKIFSIGYGFHEVFFFVKTIIDMDLST